MKASQHALERYCERVLDIPVPEIGAYLKEHGADVDQAVLDMVSKAGIIISADGEEYYLYDIFILVLANQTVITLVKSDYGFDEDMNRQIVRHQQEKVQFMRANFRDMEENALVRHAIIRTETDALDRDISLLESKLREKRTLRRQLESQAASIEAELDTLKKEIDTESAKLIYSTSWKMDVLQRKGKKRA